MTTPEPKKFDCVAMKEAAQRDMISSLEGLTPEQEIAKIRADVEAGPLADWWRSLPRDPGPQTDTTPPDRRAKQRR